jgi:CheY-like chemotaxis protein
VLYVDDEEDIREVATLALEIDPGIEVRTASSGQAALKLSADWQPDVILLDVMMPNMDGPTTLSNLRAAPATQDIPVVFITARAQPREIQDLKARGALDVMTKPFDPMELAASLRRVISR